VFALSAGCGGGDETASQQDLRKAYQEGQHAAQEQAAQARVNRKIRKLEAKLKACKESNPCTDGEATTTDSTSPDSGAAGATTSCGSGVGAGPNTSCAFAQEVASAYYQSGGQTTLPDVYSPTTGDYYTMTCTPGSPTICRGGNDASVYIP
jgi:hypothetical protein